MSADERTDGRSLGQLVAAATAELSALVHEEIALAKAELRQDVKRAGTGGGAVAVAGVLALFAVPVLSFAAAYGIHNLGLGLAWSFLIVGVAFLVLAALLGLLAVSKFKKISKPELTIASARQTAQALQNVRPHPREEAIGAAQGPAAVLPPAGGVSMDKTPVRQM